MTKIDKKVVLNKFGKKIRLNDAALEIALKHFGIVHSAPAQQVVPVEFLRLPKKIEIIKAKPTEKVELKNMPEVIQIKKDLPEEKEVIVEEKKKPEGKRLRRKKNEGDKKS